MVNEHNNDVLTKGGISVIKWYSNNIFIFLNIRTIISLESTGNATYTVIGRRSLTLK